MKDPIVIVGAGLSGLRAASLLAAKGIEYRVLEARDRVGGRVLSETVGDKPDIRKFDLGPTWFWPEHEPVISNLVKELGLPTFDQHTEGAILLQQSANGPAQRHILPEGSVQKSVRFSGGVQSLIDTVFATLPSEKVELNTRVKSISMDHGGKITISAESVDGKKKSIQAGAVILALPPRIAAEHIGFSPALPEELVQSLKDKSTWMAGQAKVVAVYEEPFWRKDGLSGQVMSWTGPLQEIHDASPETGCGALFGFFGLSAKQREELGEEKVLELVKGQLTHLFGPSAAEPLSILYKDWSGDAETAVEEDLQPLTDFPRYGEVKSNGPWEKKLIFAGTETSSEFGGHLEGALRSAERSVSDILELYKQ